MYSYILLKWSSSNWYFDLWTKNSQQKMKPLYMVIVVLTSSIYSFLCSSISDSTTAVNLNGISGIIAAYGDFNGDRYTDIFVIDENCMWLFFPSPFVCVGSIAISQRWSFPLKRLKHDMYYYFYLWQFYDVMITAVQYPGFFFVPFHQYFKENPADRF